MLSWWRSSQSQESDIPDYSPYTALQTAIPGLLISDEELGQGGYAQVLRAKCSEGEAALKMGLGASQLLQAQFACEAAALKTIGPPYAPQYYAHGLLDDGRPYILMERLAGQTLSAALAARELSLGPTITGLFEAIDTVHKRGLVHLDLKPENILVAANPEFRLSLIDFGLCRILNSAQYLGQDMAALLQPTDGPPVGSLAYMAPEMLSARPHIDASADVYSLGVILYELLTGRTPFTGDRHAISRGHLHLRPPRMSQWISIDPAVEELCLACLSKKSEERPTLATLTAKLPEIVSALPGPPAMSKERPRRRRATSHGLGLGPVQGQGESAVGLQELQPIVLLGVEGVSAFDDLATIIEQQGGFIAEIAGEVSICAFAEYTYAAPLYRALNAARLLHRKHGGCLTLHIADLKTRPARGKRPPKAYGEAVRDPRTWLPGPSGSGIVLTERAAKSAQQPIKPWSHDTRFYVLGPEHESSFSTEERMPFVGRKDLMEHARKSLESVLSERSPALFTILGEHGLGKSRIFHELQRIAGQSSKVRVIAIRGRRAASLGDDPTQKALIDALCQQAAELDDASFDIAALRAVSSVRVLGEFLRKLAESGPLALLIDDIHYAPIALLEALEYAALEGDAVPLWLVAISSPRLLQRRPTWGSLAHRSEIIELAPLSQEEAETLATYHLRPAEYVPPQFLRQLAEWSGGNPFWLSTLISTLLWSGIVRRGPQDGSFYVAIEEFSQLPDLPVGQWVAERELARLTRELAACVRMAASIGPEFTRGELVYVQEQAERAGHAATYMDIDVALEALRERGLVKQRPGDTWAFAQELFQNSVYRLTHPDERMRVHRYALKYWQAILEREPSSPALEAMARHAEACGDVQTAADSFIRLGDQARAQHVYVEADIFYSRVIKLGESLAVKQRLQAYWGRGRVRYRMQRIHEAIQDLSCAIEYANALKEPIAVAELFLEKATAFDWAGQYAESEDLVEAAEPLIGADAPPGLSARYLLAKGRAAYRDGRLDQALADLETAYQIVGNSDYETAIIALVLLGPILVEKGQLDKAETYFEQAVLFCSWSSDRFHLCVVHLNRAWLWSKRGQLKAAVDDLFRAQALARELKQPILERGAVHNLAELLHWFGDHRGAMVFAQRSYKLQRYLPEPAAADTLLLARISTACDEEAAKTFVEKARAILDRDRDMPNRRQFELFIEALELSLQIQHSASMTQWDLLVAAASENMPEEEFLEILYFRGRVAARVKEWHQLRESIARARPALTRCPIWRSSFQRLSRLIEQIGVA